MANSLLQTWIRKQQEGQKKLFLLQDSLLGTHLYSYLFFRLKFFSLNFIITTMIHLVEFYLLTHIFSGRYTTTLLTLRAIHLTINGWWWGYLELLRSKIRAYAKQGESNKIPDEIQTWLSFAFCAAICLIIYGIIWFYFQYQQHSPFDNQEIIFIIYFEVILFQIGIQFITQTFHSGAFALHRIYRPFYTIVLPDLLVLILALLLWSSLGVYALPLSFFIASLTSSFMTYWYTKRTYSLIDIPINFFNKSLTLLKARDIFLSKEATLAGLASIVMHFDGAIVLMLLIPLGAYSIKTDLLLFFYLITPQLRANYDWSRLLYFDFKKIELHTALQAFTKRFHQTIIVTALSLGVFFWITTVPLVIFFYDRTMLNLCWLLLPFFILRSLLAYLQVKAFSQNYYWDVIISGSIVLISFLALRIFNDQYQAFLILNSILLLSLLYLRKPRFSATVSFNKPYELKTLPSWLYQLKQINNPFYLYAFQLDLKTPNECIKKIQAILLKKLADDGAMTQFDKYTFALYFKNPQIETAINNPEILDLTWLINNTGGFIRKILLKERVNNSMQAINLLNDHALLSLHLNSAFNENILPSNINITNFKNKIKRAISIEFSNSYFYDPNGQPHGNLYILSASQRRQLIKKTITFLFNPTAKIKINNFHVMALCIKGQIETIFVIDIGASSKDKVRINAWKQKMAAYNLALAIR